MRDKYESQLRELNKMMIQMSELIEQSISMAIKSLMEQDAALAKKTMDFDENIDQLEKDIEGLCLRLILQQQPVASDLRVVSAALKMITDFERIGDQASDIAEISILLSDSEYVKKLAHIQKMASETTYMVVKSVEAYVERSEHKAQEVIAHDDVVDELFNQVKEDVIALIRDNKECGEQAADMLIIAKYFERIGDHATNIAEWVIFLITGVHESQQ